jgi:hypothetical protein
MQPKGTKMNEFENAQAFADLEFVTAQCEAERIVCEHSGSTSPEAVARVRALVVEEFSRPLPPGVARHTRNGLLDVFDYALNPRSLSPEAKGDPLSWVLGILAKRAHDLVTIRPNA